MLLQRHGSQMANSPLFSYVSTGGMTVFCRKYPDLCCSSKDRTTPSPTSISLDTSAIQKAQEVASPVGTPVEILPHLFLGSAKDSSDIRILQKLNITSVLNITTHCPNHFESQLEYMCIEVEDSHSADLLSKIHQAISYIGKHLHSSSHKVT